MFSRRQEKEYGQYRRHRSRRRRFTGIIVLIALIVAAYVAITYSIWWVGVGLLLAVAAGASAGDSRDRGSEED